MSNGVGSTRRWVDHPQITALLPRLRHLPTMPEANKRVLKVLDDPDFSNEQVAREISRDVGLTAQITKLVNSALFAPARPILNVAEAVTLIGLVRLRALISTAWAFHLVDESKACEGFSPGGEWAHAVAVALEAHQLATRVDASVALQETVFTSGILHDLGKILLAVNVPEYFMLAKDAADTARIPFWQAEVQVLGFHHADLGARLLTLWGMPDLVIEAVGWHHEPQLAGRDQVTPTTLVHLANCSIHKTAPDLGCAEMFRALESVQRRKTRLK